MDTLGSLVSRRAHLLNTIDSVRGLTLMDKLLDADIPADTDRDLQLGSQEDYVRTLYPQLYGSKALVKRLKN